MPSKLDHCGSLPYIASVLSVFRSTALAPNTTGRPEHSSPYLHKSTASGPRLKVWCSLRGCDQAVHCQEIHFLSLCLCSSLSELFLSILRTCLQSVIREGIDLRNRSEPGHVSWACNSLIVTVISIMWRSRVVNVCRKSDLICPGSAFIRTYLQYTHLDKLMITWPVFNRSERCHYLPVRSHTNNHIPQNNHCYILSNSTHFPHLSQFFPKLMRWPLVAFCNSPTPCGWEIKTGSQ